MDRLANQCGPHKTGQAQNPKRIIVGAHSFPGTWSDVLTMAMADFAIVRDGPYVRCIKLYLDADECSWGTA